MVPQPNPCNWFEIPVHDMERATAFYEHLLQAELAVRDFGAARMAWFPMEAGVPGATGALIQHESYTPSHAGSLIYLSVPDIDAALARAEAGGGKVLRPRTSIGEFGFVGHLEDTEGNRVALHSDR